MSNRVTWGQMKNQVGQPIGLDACSPNLLSLFNEGANELWDLGDWVGKNQRYKLRVTPDCHGNKIISWPRQIETIEKVNICNRPVGVRNQYFEFMSNAVGQIGSRGRAGYNERWGNISLLGDRSEVPTNEDIIPGDKRVRVYTERIENKGRILILGYNDAGNWIRTQLPNGEWQDGEYVDLANAPATTHNIFASITGVQFDVTPRNGNTYLYSIDPSNNERQLATYDYSVEIPSFRRSILSGLPNGDGQNCECVTVLAKMRFIPVIFDTDYCQIGNISAMKSMLQYIYKRDNDKIQDAEMYKQNAIQILNDELKQYNGYGAKKMLDFGPRQVCAASRNLQ
jgi:hypothetical protein